MVLLFFLFGLVGLAAAQTRPTCWDGLKNLWETDVDCGGSGLCPRCSLWKKCVRDTDCLSGRCAPTELYDETTRCAPVCNYNMAKDGTETDVDCGGGCKPCEIFQGCKADSDCRSPTSGPVLCLWGLCNSCHDNQKDGAETDVDCGGGSVSTCPACAVGKKCLKPADCMDSPCDGNGKCCPLPNKVKDGAETDVDCGGAGGQCTLCAVNQHCSANTDCTTNRCLAGLCACGGGNRNCDVGDNCETDNDCIMGTCVSNRCITWNNGKQDGYETDKDCGGGHFAPSCGSGKMCSGPSGHDCNEAAGLQCQLTDCKVGVIPPWTCQASGQCP